jgi:tetratricopeptide (TPR) repeat protein
MEGLLAQIYADEGKYELAESVAREVLQDKIRVLGPEHPYTLAGMNNLAAVLERAGKLSDAETLIRQNLQLRTRLYGVAVLDTLHTSCMLAEIYEKKGRLAEATGLTREILTLGKGTFAPENPVRLKTLELLGRLSIAQGKYADAESAFRDAWMGRKKNAPDHWRTAITTSWLGEALLRLQRFDEAEPLLLNGYRQLKKQSSSLPVDSQVEIASAAARIVKLYTAWSKPAQALEWQQQLSAADH